MRSPRSTPALAVPALVARMRALPVRTRYGLALAWAVVVLVASVLDPPAGGPPPVAPLGVPLDKWVHALTYAVLAGLLAYAARARAPRVLVAVVLVAAGYGFGVEVVQSFVPLREFDLVDALANAVGAAVAVVAWRLLDRRATAPGDRVG